MCQGSVGFCRDPVTKGTFSKSFKRSNAQQLFLSVFKKQSINFSFKSNKKGQTSIVAISSSCVIDGGDFAGVCKHKS